MSRPLSLLLLGALGLAPACDPPPATDGPTPGTAQAAPVKAAPGASTVAIGPDTQVATWKGGTLAYAAVDEKVGTELKLLEAQFMMDRYDKQYQAVENMVLEQLLEADAKAKGHADVEALIRAEVESKVTGVTDAEAEALYPQVARQFRYAPFEQVKDQVKAAVLQQKQAGAFQAFAMELRTAAAVEVDVPFPDLPRIEVSADDDPSLGPDDAQVTIVQFAEFQCGYCGKAQETLDQVLKDYDGKVRMVYRDYPLSFHDRAVPAAIAANCAGEQGKYWDMHRRMMEDQRSLDDATLERYATELQLDLGAWAECRVDPKQAAEVQKDFEDGMAVGVTGTPAFFINGVMLSGAQPYDRFKQILDRELDQG